jgi:hypothetical protein
MRFSHLFRLLERWTDVPMGLASHSRTGTDFFSANDSQPVFCSSQANHEAIRNVSVPQEIADAANRAERSGTIEEKPSASLIVILFYDLVSAAKAPKEQYSNTMPVEALNDRAEKPSQGESGADFHYSAVGARDARMQMRVFALLDLNLERQPAADAIQLRGYGRR